MEQLPQKAMANKGSFNSDSLQIGVMLPVESQPVDFQKALERARKLEVHGEFFLDSCSPLKDVSNTIHDDSGPIGKSLFEKLLQNVRVPQSSNIACLFVPNDRPCPEFWSRILCPPFSGVCTCLNVP